jgi:hypothetical protein
MKKITVLSLITALLSLGVIASCGKSKSKNRKQWKKYDKATRMILDEEVSEYKLTKSWIKKYDPAKNKDYVKGISKKLVVYKNLIEKLEKVEAPNGKLKEIKKVDVKSLKARRDIMKLWRDKIKANKKPEFALEFKSLNAKYNNLINERNRLVNELTRKNRKRRKGKKKWKKKRHKKKKWKKRR